MEGKETRRAVEKRHPESSLVSREFKAPGQIGINASEDRRSSACGVRLGKAPRYARLFLAQRSPRRRCNRGRGEELSGGTKKRN